jgi:ubiquinone biosynthesis protein
LPQKAIDAHCFSPVQLKGNAVTSYAAAVAERVRRILTATDRSPTADRAVAWAADMAERYKAELVVLQVLTEATGNGVAAAEAGLRELAAGIGPEARARVVVGKDPANAIVEAAEKESADVVVVGNIGMSGRKEFLLGNVPNRVSHRARCTVVIVNTGDEPRRRRLRRRR